MHTDSVDRRSRSDELLSSAQAHGRAPRQRQAAGRPGSTDATPRRSANVSWSGEHAELRDRGRRGCHRPDRHAAHGRTERHPAVDDLSRSGTAVTFTTSTVKGLEYASFAAASGTYTATYAATGALRYRAASRRGDHPGQGRRASRGDVGAPPSRRPARSRSGQLLGALTHQAQAGRRQSRSTGSTLDGLKKGTTYYYRITSRDTTGQTVLYPAATAAPATFTTSAGGHDQAPRFPIRESSC